MRETVLVKRGVLWVGAFVAAVALLGCGEAAATSASVSPSPVVTSPSPLAVPTPSPIWAKDPKLEFTSDSVSSTFIVTATNPGPGTCHHLRLELGESSDPAANATPDVRAGAIIGKVYDYKDVAEGASMVIRLSVSEARALPHNPAANDNPRSDSLEVGAAGYCEDSRGF